MLKSKVPRLSTHVESLSFSHPGRPAALVQAYGFSMGGYANSYNRRHQRCGYDFQNRYKSILVDKDSYFLELVRYIHLNSVVAGIVTDVEELRSYPWTGHAGLLNKHTQQWHNTNATLGHFGTTARRARSAYI